MTKTLSIVSRENQNLNANEAFVIFLTSKLIITCLIYWRFHIEIEIHQSFVYLLNESEHIHILDLDLEDEVHSI